MKNKDIEERLRRIEKRKKTIGSKLDRKLQKYSPNFESMFSFFLKSYRTGLLTFCGSKVLVERDSNEKNDAKFTFRKYENGQFKGKNYKSCHPNVLQAVIIAKKSWGLHVKQFSEGINEWSFTRQEIIDTFKDKNIEIPEPLLKELDNKIEKLKVIKYEKYLNEIKNKKVI